MNDILTLVEKGKYKEAIDLIAKSPKATQDMGRIIFAKADSKYELGEDLEALQEYVYYLNKYPNGYGRNFALIGVVVCLKNLEMHLEAKRFIHMIDDSHDGKDKELLDSFSILEKQRLAHKTLSTLFPLEGRLDLSVEKQQITELDWKG